MKKKISFVIPALNEEKAIGSTIDTIPQKELRKNGYDIEILVIDGGSRDKTVEIAKSKGVRVISSPKGYGRQLKFGMNKATGDIIITGDSDTTYPFEDSLKFVDILEKENLDFLNTNRFALLEKGSMSFLHFVGNYILTILTRVMFNLKIKDSQSGMWIFRKDILLKLRLTDNDMAFSEEIKIEAFRKTKAKEIGIRYKKRMGESKLNFKHAFRNTWFLIKKRFLLK